MLPGNTKSPHTGKLFVTNLRVIWTSADYQRVNLCELARSSGVHVHPFIAFTN